MYNRNVLLEPISFCVYIHEVPPTQKMEPQGPACTSSPKMSQKSNMWCQECICYCVLYMQWPHFDLCTILFFLSTSCLKKASVSSSSSWFWILTFDSKSYSALFASVKTFWSNLHFCHVTEKLMDLWLGWKCVTKLPLRAKIFSLSLTVFDFINFALMQCALV